MALSFDDWWEEHKTIRSVAGLPPDHKARDAGLIAVSKAWVSTWWSREAGSPPFFWRWRKEYQKEMCEGSPPKFIGIPQTNVKPQRVSRNPEEFDTIKKKLRKIVARSYLEKGDVESLMTFFGVPKGEDTRMVYDATACSLNSCLFAP